MLSHFFQLQTKLFLSDRKSKPLDKALKTRSDPDIQQNQRYFFRTTCELYLKTNFILQNACNVDILESIGFLNAPGLSVSYALINQ